MSKELNILKVSSAFAPVEFPPECCHDPVSEEDIVDTLIIDTYEQDAEGNIKPITKQIETKRYNRKDYIESFSDEVGLENILQKIGQGAIAEDKFSILNGMKQGQVNDLRGFANINNLGDMENLVAKAKDSFARLDPDLKKGMSFKEFVAKFNNQDLVDYVTKKTTKQEVPAGDNQ